MLALAEGVIWNIAGVIAVTVAAALIVAHLRGLTKSVTERLDKQDDRIDFAVQHLDAKVDAAVKGVSDLSTRMAACKTDCHQNFVTSEQWIRSESYTRQMLDTVIKGQAEIKGGINVLEKLPQIFGNITREVVSQVLNQKGDNRNG